MLIKDGIYFIIIKNRYIMKKIINIILVLWTAVFVMTGCNEGEKTNLKEKKSATETEIPDMGRIAAGAYYIAVLDDKNKVHIAWKTDYFSYAETENTDWGGTVRLLKNEEFPIAMSEDGKIIVPGGQSAAELWKAWQDTMQELPADAVLGSPFLNDYENAEEIGAWKDLYFVAGQYPKCMVGVLQDGTLCGAGIEEELLTTVLQWKDIREAALLYGGTKIVAVDQEDTVYAQGVDVTTWPHIRTIAAGKNMFFGLTEKGDVVHTAFVLDEDYSTEQMHGIVSIAVGYDCKKNQDVIYGIRKDGKVVDNLGMEIPGFENMAEIDVTMSDAVLVGLTRNNKMIVGEGADEHFYTLAKEYNN